MYRGRTLDMSPWSLLSRERSLRQGPGTYSGRAKYAMGGLTWGTHFGLTKLPASIMSIPACVRRLTSSTFTCGGMTADSFCSPSRGPTSTIRTSSGLTGGEVSSQVEFERVAKAGRERSRERAACLASMSVQGILSSLGVGFRASS